MHLKIGKETTQGYTRVLSKASSAECYSYGTSALIAMEFLRLSKAKNTGMLMGFCMSALRQLLFAKIKRDPNTPERLPIGTLLWGRKSEVSPKIANHALLMAAIGPLLNVIKIWPHNARETIRKKTPAKASRKKTGEAKEQIS